MSTKSAIVRKMAKKLGKDADTVRELLQESGLTITREVP